MSAEAFTADGRPVGSREALRPFGAPFKTERGARSLMTREAAYAEQAAAEQEVAEMADGTWRVLWSDKPCEDESMYADLADELNDGAPGDVSIADLNPRWVAGAERYARAEGLPWPPQVGDYDRYAERKRAAS